MDLELRSRNGSVKEGGGSAATVRDGCGFNGFAGFAIASCIAKEAFSGENGFTRRRSSGYEGWRRNGRSGFPCSKDISNWEAAPYHVLKPSTNLSPKR